MIIPQGMYGLKHDTTAHKYVQSYVEIKNEIKLQTGGDSATRPPSYKFIPDLQ